MTQQETAKDIGARVIAAIEQSQIATREAERRAAQWEEQCKQLRAALDAAERRLGETQAACLVAEDEIKRLPDDDAMTDIIQDALVELGVRTRLDTGESMRGFCNSVAGEIIDKIRAHWAMREDEATS